MSQRKNVSISLSAELHAVVERMLASGRYGNFSEVVRAALRLLDERELDFQDHRAARQAAKAQSGTQGPLSA
ncbi:type II toxin-antitoxin system ParD family antitoxin [Lichenihabitans sp. Uapishka_5]|uniref:type II toxin-antitoxin system ParD family antitoxin n=1 Tax=Lichenihabitans sp. Uapishka_5 TaxID=3037302 RepID=UPI0029E7EB36|nr:type II toxin-antitoxin system ParD family antitoxin [Lichenihabitans sp. Uapishka_5]MDX7951779.1 type II toxin-antitoxin system ParD family antitoxin [Lichenihabitans sp. Uapishka_5]